MCHTWLVVLPKFDLFESVWEAGLSLGPPPFGWQKMVSRSMGPSQTDPGEDLGETPLWRIFEMNTKIQILITVEAGPCTVNDLQSNFRHLSWRLAIHSTFFAFHQDFLQGTWTVLWYAKQLVCSSHWQLPKVWSFGNCVKQTSAGAFLGIFTWGVLQEKNDQTNKH